MANKRLVQYIRSQLSKGVSLEAIKLTLSAKGWRDYDINEAAKLAMASKKTKIKKTYLMVLVLIAGIVSVYFLLFSGPASDSEPQITDCGTDFDCFIAASADCDESKALHEVSLEIFGMIATSVTYMELQGMESGRCVYYQRTESSSVEFSEELVQQMLDSGITQEEIEQQEEAANDSAQATVGTETTCRFMPSDLTDMLNRWKQGNFGSDDLTGTECEGGFSQTVL